MTSRRPVANRPAYAELRRLYLDDGLSCPDIARALRCDPTTVHRWLKLAGVPTRPRGDLANMKGRRRPADWRPSADARAKIGAASKARWDSGAMAGRKHWLKDAPPEMNPRWLGGITPERQAFYSTREWKAACVEVYARADGYCQRCGADSRPERHTPDRFHIHHIVSFKVRELRAEPTNLVLLCQPGHRWVHSAGNTDRVLICADAAEFEARQPTLFDILDAGRNRAEAA